MRKLVVFLSVATLLVSSNALAQVDPDPDMVGFYFDENATEFCAETPVGTQIPVYLCFTNPSDIGAEPDFFTISGWECSYTATLPTGVFILSETLRGIQPTNFSSFEDDFIVGLGVPFNWAPVVVVLEVLVGVFGPGEINFTVYPAFNSSFDPPSPGYASGDDPNVLIPCGYSAGIDPASGDPNVCAVLNGECTPIANEDMTWGGIKAIYK